MQKILVTGGAGYIGSHTVVNLFEQGFEVVIVDNFSNSVSSSIEGINSILKTKIKNYEVNVCDLEKIEEVFKKEKNIVGIVHFAAFKAVNDSVNNPLKYYENNLSSLINLLKLSEKYKVKAFVFSSSASVYGNTKDLPVSETTPLEDAECPYAATKQMGEIILKDFANVAETSCLALRYFNPVGAHHSALIGEYPLEAPKNLGPIITQTAAGLRESLTVFGDDYETRDGTCIRDYVHVMDLADAHSKALKYLLEEKRQYDVINLGSGIGSTVLEAIKAFEKASGIKLNYKIGPRREGDMAASYCSNAKAKEVLGWEPKRDINDMMASAWKWQQHLSKL